MESKPEEEAQETQNQNKVEEIDDKGEVRYLYFYQNI